MNSINKKLYTVIAVCLLILTLTVSAMAENGTSSEVVVTSSNPIASDTTGTESDTASDTQSSDDTSLTESGTSDLTSDTSDISDVSVSSDLTNSDSSVTSQSNTTSYSGTTDTTTSKKSTYYGNVGGTVSDGIDTSGWGTGEEEVSSELASVGTTEKTGSKKIGSYSNLLWILIWIPILLIIGSVAALIYVNRKAFLNGDTSGGKDKGNKPDKSANDKNKRKNNHKNRTNIYRPRD